MVSTLICLRSAPQRTHQAVHRTIEQRHLVHHDCTARMHLCSELVQRVLAHGLPLPVDEQVSGLEWADVGELDLMTLLLAAEFEPGSGLEAARELAVLIAFLDSGRRCARNAGQLDLVDLDLALAEGVLDDDSGEVQRILVGLRLIFPSRLWRGRFWRSRLRRSRCWRIRLWRSRFWRSRFWRS